jgi:hypothetical protein
MPTQILEQDLANKVVTSPKLDDNIAINQTLTIGTHAMAGSSLGTDGYVSVVGDIRNPTATMSLLSGAPDGFASVGFDFNSSNTINDLGSILLRLRNAGTSVFSIDGYGNITLGGDIISTSQPFTIKDAYTPIPIPFSDTAHTTLPPGRQSLLDAILNAGTVTDLDSAYDGDAGSGDGREIIVDSGPVSLQRYFGGSSDPLLEIGDGYSTNLLEFLADGTIVGGSSPFVLRSRESDTVSGTAFRFDTDNSLSDTADLFSLRNLSSTVLQIKADGDHTWGTNLAPRFTASPPSTIADDAAFTLNTTATDQSDSILNLEHNSTKVFNFDGYGLLHIFNTNVQFGVRDGYVRLFSDLSQIQFQNSVGEFLTASSADLTLSSPLSNLNKIILDGTNDNKIRFISGVSDLASSIGFDYDTINLLNTPGSKLVAWKVGGSEVASIDGYGNATFNKLNVNSGIVNSPTAVLQFQDSNATSPVPFSDPSNTGLPSGMTSILDGLNDAATIAALTLLDSYTLTEDVVVPAGQNFVVISSAGALPSEVAASAFTTDVGVIVALGTTMGVHSTVTNQLKNRAFIRDATTNDPIYDGYGQEIFALLGAEAGTGGSNFSTSTPDRLQLSFVTTNPITDAIEAVDVAAIENKTIEYTYNRRITLANATEEALAAGFLFDSVPDHLNTSYDGYSGAGSGRHIVADGGPVNIRVPDGYASTTLELIKESTLDGYGLLISNSSDRPSIYINQIAGPSVTFANDNLNDVGRPGANRPRSVYVGTQVVVGNTIVVNSSEISGTTGLTATAQTGNILLRSPGSNVTGSPVINILATGTRIVVNPYDKALVQLDNFDRTVLRVDGYGSLHLGDSSDAYGLDASRIVFNANKYHSTTLPSSNDDAGLFVERGYLTSPAKLLWDEGNRRWELDNGDTLRRNILSFPKVVINEDLTVCQSSGDPLKVNQPYAWQRALINRIAINTTCTDYDFEIYESGLFSDPVFALTHADGYVNSRTTLYYEDLDGYDFLHYKITNNTDVAAFFDIFCRAEVFFEGYTTTNLIETFDNGDFCAPVFGAAFSENFEGTEFDAPTGTLIFSESFDSYGIFDAYAGPILDSEDMNSLGF